MPNFGLPDPYGIEGGAPGVNPLAHAYDRDHPITKPLDANRMAFFLGARPVLAARKPEAEDRLSVIVHSSPRAWLSRDFERIARGLPPEDRDGTLFYAEDGGTIKEVFLNTRGLPRSRRSTPALRAARAGRHRRRADRRRHDGP